MSRVYKADRRKFPGDVFPCLDRLASHAKGGQVTGVAFVCLLEGEKYIADTCGSATHEPDTVRLLLRALDAKVAKRQLKNR